MGKNQTLCVVAYAFKLYTLAWWSNLREWRWFQFQLANTFNPVNFVWDDIYGRIGAKAIKGDVGTRNGFRDNHFHNSVPCNAVCVCVRARPLKKIDSRWKKVTGSDDIMWQQTCCVFKRVVHTPNKATPRVCHHLPLWLKIAPQIKKKDETIILCL